MESKFKVGDCVQLIHGDKTNMTIAAIDSSPLEDANRIVCNWFDKGKPMEFKFLETALKPCDNTDNGSQTLRMNEMLNPKRR